MRAIANEQLDGFPPKSELRTVFVEHDIDASEAETAVVEYVFLDPVLQGAHHQTLEPSKKFQGAPHSPSLPNCRFLRYLTSETHIEPNNCLCFGDRCW